MTILEIASLPVFGAVSLKLFEWTRKLILQNQRAKKTVAEAGLINAEADALVSDSWQVLFNHVNVEWKLAMAAMKKSQQDIIELKILLKQERAERSRLLLQEKTECDEKMGVLYQKIQQLELNQKN